MPEYYLRVTVPFEGLTDVNNEQFVQNNQGRYLIPVGDLNQTNKEIWKLCRFEVFKYWPVQRNSSNKSTKKDLDLENKLVSDRFLLFGKSCLLPFSPNITVEYDDVPFRNNIQLYAGIFGDGECEFEQNGSIVYIDLFLVPKYVNELVEGSSETALYREHKSKLITPETARKKIRTNDKIEYKTLPSEKQLNEKSSFDVKLRSNNAFSIIADRLEELGASARNARSLGNLKRLTSERSSEGEGTGEGSSDYNEDKRHKSGGKRKSRKRRSRRTKRKTRK